MGKGIICVPDSIFFERKKRERELGRLGIEGI